MAKIYIIESMPVIIDRLTAALPADHEVMICRDPRRALKDLDTFRPDLLIVDLTMPEFGGIGLLNTAFTAGIRPKLLVSAGHMDAIAEDRLNIIDTGYVFMRPFSVKAVADAAVDLLMRLDDSEEADLRRIANDLLLRLGLRVDLQGYRYTLEAVVYICDHMDCMISGELYPAVAQICGGNARQVEHAIRGCIQKAWFKRDDQVWSMYFPKDNEGRTLHLTNGAFLKRIAFAVIDFYTYCKRKKAKSQ